jgi:hypothetical protein
MEKTQLQSLFAMILDKIAQLQLKPEPGLDK